MTTYAAISLGLGVGLIFGILLTLSIQEIARSYRAHQQNRRTLHPGWDQ